MVTQRPERSGRPTRPRWSIGAAVAAGVVLALLLALFLSPEAFWSGGVGVLRGTRRAFAEVPGLGGLSWDSLGLFVALFPLIASVAGPSRPGIVLGALGLAGIATVNDSRFLAASWSLLAFACTLREGPERWRWTGAVAATLLAGAGLSPLFVQGMSRTLATPVGHGGVLDIAGIGLVRHFLVVRFGGWLVDLVAAPPVLLCAASVCLAATAVRGCGPIAIAAGPLLLLKLLPLVQLTVREGPTRASALVIPGTLLVAWAGLRLPPRPAREGLLGIGGAFVLLASRMLVEAAVWTVAWAIAASEGPRGERGMLVLAAAASVPMLAAYGTGPANAVRLLSCLILAVGVLGACREGTSRVGPASVVLGIATLLLSLPPLGARFWPLWTGKLRPTLPIGQAPWLLVLAGAALGLLVGVVPRTWRIEGRLAGLERKGLTQFRRLVSPAVDTVAVIWVALERFGWQGLTLWLPRRALAALSITVAWFHSVVLPALSRIPLHVMSLVRIVTAHPLSSMRWLSLLVGLLLVAAWLL